MPQVLTAFFITAFFFVGTAAWTCGHDEDGCRRTFTDTIRTYLKR